MAYIAFGVASYLAFRFKRERDGYKAEAAWLRSERNRIKTVI